MSVIFVVEEAFLACLSDFCLIFHSFVKKRSRTYLMVNFVSSLICPEPHQSRRIFDDYSIIPSDLVFLLVHSSVVVTYDRQEKTKFHLTLAQLQLQKKTSRLRKKIRAYIFLQY